MPTIDERVVEMRFDNGQFERNVNQSMSTLDKLKAALNFDKSADGLKNLQNAGRGFNLNPVATAVETVTSKLSAMEIIGISALNRLTNQGMAMMERFVKSVSIDQLSAGFTKYGQKTSAVQTIMAATAKDFEGVGGQMEYVNEQLTKLNWFTDETSYSFLDMVNNIGKFTSNGIKLDSAVTSMQGISTWAALSGANVQEASRAMYNLAQAISTGSVKLIDWKSIENANMATAEFKETVIQTALELGTLEKKGDKVFVKGSKKAEVSVTKFNSELSKGWFSSEVLQKSLARYGEFTNKLYEFADATGETATELIGMIDEYIEADDKTQFITKHAEELDMSVEELTTHLNTLSSSEMELGRKAFKAAQEAKTFEEAVNSVKDAVSTGWMQSFEHIFGNYEEAKKIWTALANEMWDVFAGGGERRNNILEMWHNGWQELDKDGNIIMKMAGGYDVLYEAIGNLWQGIKNLMSPMQDAWDIIFGVSEKERARQLIVLTNRFKDFSLKVKGFITQVEKPFEKFGKAVDTVSKDVKGALDGVTKPLDKITDDAKKVGELISTVERTERDLGRLTQEVLADKYGTGDKRRKALRELGYSYEVVQNEINRLSNCSKRHQILQKDLEKVHQDTTKAVKEESEATEELSKDMSASERRYYNLLRIFRGLFAAVDVVKKGFTEAGKAVTKIFAHALEKAMPVFDGILGALGDFGDKVYEFRENLGKNNSIADFFNKVADAVNNFVDKFSDFISRVWNKIANSEALPRLIGALKTLKDTLIEFVSAGLSKLMEMFNNIDVEKVSDIINGIFGWVADTSSDAIEYMVSHKEDVKKFFGVFSGTVAKTIGSIGQGFSDLWKGLDGYKTSSAKEVGGFFENLFASFNAMFADENSTFNKVKGSIDKFTKAITDLFTNMTPEKGGDLLKKGAFALLTVTISEFILSLSGAVKSLKDVPKTLVEVLTGVAGALDAYQTGVRADAILKVAKAIGILALAIIALAFIPEDALVNATSSLITLMGLLAVIMAIYAKIISTKFQTFDKFKPINNFLNALRDIAKRFAKIAAVGAVFVGIAATVAAFAYLVKMVKEVDLHAIGDAFAYMTTLLFEVGTFIALLMLLDKKLGGTSLKGIGTAMFGLGVGLLAIAGAAKILSTIELNVMGPVIGNIMGLLLAMAAASRIGNGTTMIKMATGMIIFAGALAILTPVLLAMSALPMDKVNNVLISLGISLAALVGMSMLMSAMDAFTKNGTSVADNIMKLAFSVAILSGTIIALGASPATEAGVKALANALLIISIAAGWAIIVSAGMETLSQTLINISVAAIVFGAGCALVGAGIYLVAKALPLLVDGIIHVGEQIQENGDKIVVAIGVILLAVFAAIVMAKSGFVKAVSTTLGGFFEAVQNSVPKMLITVASVILIVIAFLTQLAPKIVDKLFELLISIIAGLGVTLRTRGAELMMALGVLLNGLFILVLEAMRAIVSAVFGKAVGDFIFGNTIDDMEKSGEEMSKRLKESMEKHSSDIDLDSMIADSITEGTKAEEAAYEKGGSIVDQYQKGLSTDFDPKKVNLQDKTEGLIETAAENSKPAARKKAHEVSEELIAAGVEGIVEGEDDLYNASTNTLGIVSKKAAAQAAGMAEFVGEQWDQGVAGGIRSKAYIVNAAARVVASGISSVANKELQIKSPSKVGETLGKFWDMGVGRGISKNVDLATNPAEAGANAIVTKMRNALDTIGSSVIEDMRPKISPVLDLSNIQNGANLVNSMFSGTTAQLAFAASGSFVPQKESMMDAFRMALSGSMEDISAKLDDINVNGVYKFETPVILNGREIARGTAEYTREELNKLDRINSRKGGKL